MQQRVNYGKAGAVLLDGGLGEGKTTLAVLMADTLNADKQLRPISLDPKFHPQIAMGAGEFKRNLLICAKEKYPVLIYDEAGDFNTRGFISKLNRDLYRTFNIYRAFKVIVLLCLPAMTDLDGGIFKLNVLRFGLHLSDRNQSRGKFRCYSLKQLIMIRHNLSKRRIPAAFCYKGTYPLYSGTFKNLSPERAKQLEYLSTLAKFKVSKDMLDTEDKEDETDY